MDNIHRNTLNDLAIRSHELARDNDWDEPDYRQPETCACGSQIEAKLTCAYCHNHICKDCGVYDERWWEWVCRPAGDEETSECQRLLDVRLSDDRAKYVKLGKVFKMLKENENGKEKDY